ncbi:MAG: sensor histidine kinase, partial [Chloroflexota bacterium]
AVHHLALELRPAVLDDIGLVAAVERYAQECAQRYDLAVDFAAVGADRFRLIPAAETAIYRVIQAALTNVVQHAGARHASILLERRDQKLVAIVEDDGHGFDLGAVQAGPLEGRLGLAGMEERAALIGAVLTVETKPGAGTGVFIEVPIERNSRGLQG